LTALARLGLGIGANTAIYSVIHGALRLPYPHSERMVGVQNVFPHAAGLPARGRAYARTGSTSGASHHGWL
jgi:hypothetical protein